VAGERGAVFLELIDVGAGRHAGKISSGPTRIARRKYARSRQLGYAANAVPA
jgi:hypothetical protein